jgi:hypothetical protein
MQSFYIEQRAGGQEQSTSIEFFIIIFSIIFSYKINDQCVRDQNLAAPKRSSPTTMDSEITSNLKHIPERSHKGGTIHVSYPLGCTQSNYLGLHLLHQGMKIGGLGCIEHSRVLVGRATHSVHVAVAMAPYHHHSQKCSVVQIGQQI